MLQLLSADEVANASTEPTQHVEASVPTIASHQPSPIQDALESIRIGLRDVANETVRNIQQLSQATVEQAMDIGQRLWRMQRDLKRKEYGAFLGILGWATGKARKYINLAKTFADFDPSQLIRVELTTLLSLCQARYSSVVAQLREVQDITQQLVEQLIKENRQVRSPKQDPITGWKRNRAGGGRRYEVILHDEVTGLSIESQAQAEGLLPQRVIAEAVAARYEQKSNGTVQVSQYRAAQLEELPVVVEHARNLDAENRRLMHELLKRDQRIADLEARQSERAAACSVKPDDVQKLGLPHQVQPEIEDEVALASKKLEQHLASLVQEIAPEHTTPHSGGAAEHESRIAEATDYPEPERKTEYLEQGKEDDSLVTKGQDVQSLEPKPQVFHVGDTVKIISSRQGAEFVGLLGVVLVANTVGCVVEVRGKTKWFCLDELIVVSAATQTREKPAQNGRTSFTP